MGKGLFERAAGGSRYSGDPWPSLGTPVYYTILYYTILYYTILGYRSGISPPPIASGAGDQSPNTGMRFEAATSKQGLPKCSLRDPKDHRITRILHSGPEAQHRGDSKKNMGFGRILIVFCGRLDPLSVFLRASPRLVAERIVLSAAPQKDDGSVASSGGRGRRLHTESCEPPDYISRGGLAGERRGFS